MKWEPVSNGSKKRHWFIFKNLSGSGSGLILRARNGRIRRFESYESAKKVCDKLNQFSLEEK